jgi:hypothetical protein
MRLRIAEVRTNQVALKLCSSKVRNVSRPLARENPPTA